jgi:luciferase family oxidoreductase group 1
MASTSTPVPLSLLDLFPVSTSTPPAEVIRRSAEVIQYAEALGFVRYWIAEHHNMRNIATSAPEVLIPYLASVTRRIRVGAGGIMLPNHTPLRVVEIFRTLEALFPDRIDLGLGRAPGTDPVTAAALRRSDDGRGDVNDVDERLAELIAFDRGGFPEDHPFSRITPMPSDVRLPPIYMLGSTLAGATIAASLGVRYAFAGQFMMRNARAALAHYRAHFRPSADVTVPYAILGVTVVCGEDDEHARRLAAPLRLGIVLLRTGRSAPFVSVEEALAYKFTRDEDAIANDFFAGAVIGGPETVRAGLDRLVQETGADELMIATMVPDFEERKKSYRRVAEVFSGVAPR